MQTIQISQLSLLGECDDKWRYNRDFKVGFLKERSVLGSIMQKRNSNKGKTSSTKMTVRPAMHEWIEVGFFILEESGYQDMDRT